MNDDRLALIVARLLQFGVLVTAAVVCFGLLLALAQHAGISTHHYSPHAMSGRQLVPHVQDLIHLKAGAWLETGLFMLIGLPVLRVALCLVGFWMERDRLYVALTATVLLVLLGSIFL